MTPPRPTEPLLEMEHADISFRAFPSALRIADVDWRVQPGQYWVVGGMPESGKTELLETAAGLHRPMRGVVRLFGENLAELPEPRLLKQRARIGFVFKNIGRIFEDMTVAENIALPLRYHHNMRVEDALKTVHELLRLIEAGDVGAISSQRLGGSMNQRLDLARALALKPEILFLDEPLSGLGWRHREWWLNFLQQLNEGHPFMNGRKATIIVTTNDFTPWQGRSAQFALIREKRWQILGELTELPHV
jgi:ABC-type transporter Mla maintaining outer membrane lipid asymmetry ATPase subunit MlaF